MSARATSGSMARTAAISSSKVASGPIGGGQMKSGLWPLSGISSHNGSRSSVTAASRIRRSQGRW